MAKKIFEYIIIICFFALLTIAITYPAIFNVSKKLIGNSGDNYQFLSFQYVALNNIISGKSPLSTNNFFRYPVGFEFARGFDSTFQIIFGALLSYLIGVDSVTSYNICIFLIFIINALASYILFKKISKSILISVIGSTIYGFSYYVIARGAGHTNLMLIGGFPLLFYSVLGLNSKVSKKNFYIFFCAILLIAVGSVQYLLFLLLFTAIFLPLIWIIHRKEILELFKSLYENRKLILFPLAFFLVIFALLYFPFIKALFIHKNFTWPDSKMMFLDLKPGWLDYIIPNQFLKLLIPQVINNPNPTKIDKVVFFGFVEIVLFICFLFSKISKKIKLLLSISILIFITFPYLSYRYLYTIFPFSTTAEIGRYYVFYYLFVTMAIVYLLTNIKNKYRYAILFTLLILVIIERLPKQYYLSDLGFNESIYSTIRNQDTEGILVIPDSTWYSKYNLIPVLTGKKLVGGYIHWSNNDDQANAFIDNCGDLKRFHIEEKNNRVINIDYETIQNRAMIQCLKKNNVNIILFDKFYRVYWENYQYMLARTTLFFPHISTINETNSVTKLETTRWSQNKLYYELYFPKKGFFYIHNIHYSTPIKEKRISISLNNNTIDTSDWTTILNNEWNRWTLRLNPPKPYLVEVNAGSKLIFSSDEYAPNDGFLNLWYEFYEDKNSQVIHNQKSELDKIYEDPETEIWRLN